MLDLAEDSAKRAEVWRFCDMVISNDKDRAQAHAHGHEWYLEKGYKNDDQLMARSVRGRWVFYKPPQIDSPSEVASLTPEYVENGLIGAGELAVVSELEWIIFEDH